MKRRLIAGLGGIAIALLLWEGLSVSPLVPAGSIPGPAAVEAQAVVLVTSPSFLQALTATILAWLLSLSITAAIAVPTGLVLGALPVVRAAATSVVDMVRSVPGVALVPLATVALGAGPQTKITLAVLAGMWPVLLSVLGAMDEMDPAFVETAHANGLGPVRTLFRVRFPATIPAAVTGFRLSVALELVVLVSTELLTANGYPGLGAFLFQTGETTGDIATVLAGALLAGLLGCVANFAVGSFARPWHTQSISAPARDMSRRGRTTRFVLTMLSIVGALGIWQLATMRFRSPYAPTPRQIAGAAWQLWFEGPSGHPELTQLAIGNILPSVARIGMGFGLAVLIGVGVGALAGRRKWLGDLIEPPVAFLRAVPPSLMLPVFMAWLSIGTPLEVATIASGATWPILQATIDGVRSIDQQTLDAAASFRIRRWRRVVSIVLPAAAPRILTGMRIALSLSVILMVVAELVGASNGIGYELLTEQSEFAFPAMWAWLALVALLGYLANRGLTAAERRFTPNQISIAT